MKATLTSIELKNIFKFFPLSMYAMNILKQLNATDCVEFKKTGMGKMHYTMTLWNNVEELKNFARSGAHLDAMKKGAKIAREIRTLTIDADKLPDWTEAKLLLVTQGKALRF